jgi:hypothetical protein
MTPVKPQGTTALSDDEKFLLIVNLTPATSISVVNLDERTFVGEIATPGCTHVYPAGNRDFNVICGDGSFMGISLDEQGKLKQQVRREPLLTDSQREDNWRIAGHQHLAIHDKSRLLFALMIQGAPEMFEDPGTEVWVYDLDSHERVKVIELEHEALSMSIDQGSSPQLYIVGVDLQIPFLVAAWIYPSEGMDKIYRIATFSFDTYDITSGQLKHSMPKVGNFPNLIQPWHKFNHMAEFKRVLNGYKILPFTWVSPASRLLMMLEFLTAVALLLPDTRLMGALLAANLMLIYGGAMAINLLRGRRLLDCGCHLNSQKQPISWQAVVRNLMFTGTMLLLLLPQSTRVLNFLDGALIIFGVAITSLIYIIFHQLNYAQSLQLKG